MPGSSLMPPLPGVTALPLKDALRGLRFGVRMAGEALAPPAPPTGAPGARMRRSLLAEVDRMGDDLSRVTSAALHRALDPAQPAHDGLLDIRRSEAPELVFAAAAYHGLDRALRRLGADELLVSETLAAAAYRTAGRHLTPGATDGEQAARYMLALRAAGAVGAPPGIPWALSQCGDRLASLAVFALMLWMLVDRGDAEEDTLLALCVDVATTLEEPILGAGGDAGRLAELFSAHARVI